MKNPLFSATPAQWKEFEAHLRMAARHSGAKYGDIFPQGASHEERLLRESDLQIQIQDNGEVEFSFAWEDYWCGSNDSGHFVVDNSLIGRTESEMQAHYQMLVLEREEANRKQREAEESKQAEYAADSKKARFEEFLKLQEEFGGILTTDNADKFFGGKRNSSNNE